MGKQAIRPENVWDGSTTTLPIHLYLGLFRFAFFRAGPKLTYGVVAVGEGAKLTIHLEQG